MPKAFDFSLSLTFILFLKPVLLIVETGCTAAMTGTKGGREILAEPSDEFACGCKGVPGLRE